MAQGDTGPIPIGHTLDGKYRVRRVLGKGSMGIVYLADDVALERKVAIKVLAPHYAANERVAKRFRREAVAMASVVNENVVQIFAFGDHQGHPYFVMEYVPGYTVARLVENANERGEQLYLDVALGILGQVCRGLHAVHAKGIVHRDVKPANMLIGPRFRVAVTDFGLVETINQGKGRDLAGTPLYLAPELILRRSIPDEQRHLSDIYALGISAYEMLTGSVPYDDTNIKEILRRHVEDTPAPVSEIRSDLPSAVDAVIQRATAKEPSDRYPDCMAFLDALSAARSGGSAAPRTGGQRVLVLHPSQDARTIYTTALKVGFPEAIILDAESAEAALEMARAHRFDLIISGIDPAEGGIALLRELADDDLTARVPVIVLARELLPDMRSALRALGNVREILWGRIELTHLVNVARQHLSPDHTP